MAAIGLVKADMASVTTTAYMAIQPASGEEWRLVNIFANSTIEVYMYDGTLEILIASDSKSLLSFNFPITNTDYIRVKNTEGTTKVLGYSGFTTKEAT